MSTSERIIYRVKPAVFIFLFLIAFTLVGFKLRMPREGQELFELRRELISVRSDMALLRRNLYDLRRQSMALRRDQNSMRFNIKAGIF